MLQLRLFLLFPLNLILNPPLLSDAATHLYEGSYPHTSLVPLVTNQDDPMSCDGGQSRRYYLSDYYLYYSNNHSLIDYSNVQNRVLIIINTATECGWGKQTFREIVELYRKYKDWGLQFVLMPTDQFGRQEPYSDYNGEIEERLRQKDMIPDCVSKVMNVSSGKLQYRYLMEAEGQGSESSDSESDPRSQWQHNWDLKKLCEQDDDYYVEYNKTIWVDQIQNVKLNETGTQSSQTTTLTHPEEYHDPPPLRQIKKYQTRGLSTREIQQAILTEQPLPTTSGPSASESNKMSLTGDFTSYLYQQGVSGVISDISQSTLRMLSEGVSNTVEQVQNIVIPSDLDSVPDGYIKYTYDDNTTEIIENEEQYNEHLSEKPQELRRNGKIIRRQIKKTITKRKPKIPFILLQKQSSVSSKDAHPLFALLQIGCTGSAANYGLEIRWNYEKFLIDKSGKPLYRLRAYQSLYKIEYYLRRALGIDEGEDHPEVEEEEIVADDGISGGGRGKKVRQEEL